MKVLLFPPSDIDLHFYYVDWANALLEIGVDLVLFEERYQDLVKNQEALRDKILSLRPDVVLGFDLYFMGLKQEDSVLIRPLFDLMNLPYVSIFTANVLGQVSALVSPSRFFDYLVGVVSVPEEGKELVERALGLDCRPVDFSYPDISVNPEEWEVGDTVLVQNISHQERRWRFSEEFVWQDFQDIKRQIKDLLNQGANIGKVMGLFREGLGWSVVSCQVVEDAYWQWHREFFDRIETSLENGGLEVMDKLVVRSLEDAVNLMRRFRVVVGERPRFSSSRLSRLDWSALRVGGVPMVFESEFPDVDWWWRIREDLSNLEEVVKRLSEGSVRKEVF